ncbi:MAG: M28 family peptidase [Longimicrobiales bacterium]
MRVCSTHAASLLLCAFFVGLPGGARGQQVEVPPRVRAAADRITAEQLGRDLAYLSSDALLGRNTPSPGFDSAAAYIARRLARAGLKPLGDDGTFFQHYDLRDETVETATAYLDVARRRFRFGDDFIMRTFAGALYGNFPVVYVGHGWTVPGQHIDPYADVDVRGKILLVHGFTAPRNVEVQQIGRITANASPAIVEAQRRGAAGIMYIAPPSALESWDQARRMNLTRLELDPIVPSAYAAPALTSVVLRPQVTEALLAGERIAGAELTARGEADDYPASFQLGKTITLNVPVATEGLHRPYNVVAMLEGGDPALRNEYITIASHLDGAVGRTALNGDSIYNAADDNATGSAATLAMAEQMMNAPRPKRSIIFIWDSGEERGLWGTRRFVHRPPVLLEAIVAHFNIDMIGANRAPGSPDAASAETTGPNEVYLVGPGVLSARVDTLLVRVNRGYLNLRYNRAFDLGNHPFFYPRTDAGPFLERGVLTIGYFTGLHDRYHRPSDEARYMDTGKMESIARTIFASAWMLADSAERPRIDKEIPPSVPRHR